MTPLAARQHVMIVTSMSHHGRIQFVANHGSISNLQRRVLSVTVTSSWTCFVDDSDVIKGASAVDDTDVVMCVFNW